MEFEEFLAGLFRAQGYTAELTPTSCVFALKLVPLSLNQFIATAVAGKVAALTTEKHLESRAMHGSRKAFDQALSKVPAAQPDEFDRPG